jgi:hypothetical protein
MTGAAPRPAEHRDRAADSRADLDLRAAFPATLPLAGAAFAAMLQLSFPCERWPLDGIRRLWSGVAALALSWAIGIGAYGRHAVRGLARRTAAAGPWALAHPLPHGARSALDRVLAAYADGVTWIRATSDDWITTAALSFLGVGIIAHVAVGLRWPFALKAR